MKYLRPVLLFVIVAGLVLPTGCSLFSSKANWTIIAYYDGNCDLDLSKNGNSWVIAEAQEIEKVGSTDKVHVVGMVGSLKTGGQCKYYHLEKYDNELPDQLSSPVLEDLGTKDMSDKATLANFIKYCKDNYPAEHYMLMIKNHGAGWKGACVDEQNGGGHIMSMPEIREAIGTNHFDIIAFDACLMSMVEVAYELRGCADYLVASQFVTYAGTYGGEEWLGYLTTNPGASGLDLGKRIVDACMNANNRNQFTGHGAVIDLSKLDALASRISTLGSDLVTHTGNYAGEIFDAFGKTHSTDLDDPANCDLREFCVKLRDEPGLSTIQAILDDCNNLISAINDAVPLTKTNAVGISRGGLCIYFPYQSTMFDSASYVKCQFQSTAWQNFLSKFIAALGGGGGTGDLHINSTPTGAAVWVDGTNTGQVTNVQFTDVQPGTYSVTLKLNGYNDWTDNDVQVVAGQTTTVNATLQQGGGGNTVVAGTVSWPGHTLSANTIAFLDSSHTNTIVIFQQSAVNPANGTFRMEFNLTSQVEVYVEGWDDADGSGNSSVGDGLGFWDVNNNGQWDDMFVLQPGANITNAQVVLYDISDSDRPRHRLSDR